MKQGRNIIHQIQLHQEEFSRLESKILELEQKMMKMQMVQRNHLIRIKNREEISDDAILSGKTYQDLSPEKAWKLYQNPDFNFILIDVSAADFEPPHVIPEATRMPWESFQERSLEIQNFTTPIFVISEDGTKSILACEMLVKRGFYNCNNVSGGYQFWKGGRLKAMESA